MTFGVHAELLRSLKDQRDIEAWNFFKSYEH